MSLRHDDDLNLESDYIILETLYNSSRTIVYKAIGKGDRNPHILKASKTGLSADIVIKYKREYEITNQQHFQGIVKAKTIKKHKDQIFIAFEDIGGESLKSIMKHKCFNLKDTLSLSIQIIKILGRIHSANIVHKDINPSNIIYNSATNKLQIIDFGISSILSVENPVIKNPNILEGTLAYVSPEQTGRMNRFIDYRTDFYSFGIMLYEMLTGQKTFKTDDPIELVHCHIAKQPVAPIRLNSKIPAAVSDIVMKLIAKTAEDRYQSTIGIQTDLEYCLDHIIRGEKIVDFHLANNDISERLKIPGKLYGREKEIQTLLTAFDNTFTRDPFLMKKGIVMVSGYSGIGKTSLVKEISTSITRKRGYFISGKCSQFQGNIPYMAFAMAFSRLIRQLLTENEDRLEYYRSRFVDALGRGGRVIMEVVPEFEKIIGPQPELEKLPPVQAQNRLNRVAKNFMKVFCNPEQPLVIFFDDLQWADAATLNLLSLMIKDDDLNHLFFIGAFRDNEVFPGHPLSNMIEEIKKKDIRINRIVLSPLDIEKTASLLSDTLHRKNQTVRPLAELIIKKTRGNPFFINEFLKMLYHDKHLVFDLEKRSWEWDIKEINNLSITDNVIDLMLKKIRMLPEYTQKTLGYAACIGNPFDLFVLSELNETVASVTMTTLQPALFEGLIIPTAGSEISDASDIMTSELLFHQYQFLHDRFYQAAYALLSEEEKKRIHLNVGRILYQMTPNNKIAEKIFEITDHFNEGGALINDEAEAVNIASLNLSAGKKAKDSTAYSASLAYFKSGIKFLKNPWGKNYELALALYKERISSEYLNGNFEQSESLIHEVVGKVTSEIDKAEIYSQLIVLYTMQTKYGEAIQAGIMALKMLEIIVPEKDIENAITVELESVKRNLGNRKIMELFDAPEMTAPEKKTAMKILMSLNGAAYFADKYMYAWVLAKMTNISLKYGNIPESAKGYASYGNVLVSFLHDYKAGYEFGVLGVRLSEKYNNLAFKCQACTALTDFINHWVNPIHQSDTISQEGYLAGLESGELQYVGYILTGKIVNLFYQGKNLDKILVEADRYLTFNKKAKNQLAYDNILGSKLAITNLTGTGPGKYDFSADGVDEKAYLKTCETNKTFVGICLFKIMKAQILFTYGSYREAKETFEDVKNLFSYILGFISLAEHRFYESLCLAALYEKSSVDEQVEYLNRIEEHQQQIKIWVDHCPENFECMDLLIAAERARITNNDPAAMDLYDQAVLSAVKNNFIQIEAVANELAGKFWIGRHKNHIAELYLKKAYSAYLKWGAKRKAEAIEEEFPNCLDITPYRGEASVNIAEKDDVDSDGKPSAYFDLAAVIKAYQAISSEIQLSSLLKKLMDILIENAGARKGILILEKNNVYWVEALGSVEADNVMLLSIKLENYEALARSVIHYVIRTRESVVLENASIEEMFRHDPYVHQHQIRSIICIPIIHQAQLTGVLYLENNLNTGAFTASRVKMLELLSSQAAISIENAKLYTRYRSLYDEAVEGIFQSTPEGKLTDVNPTAAKILGYDSQEELIQSITDLENQLYVIPEDRDRFRRIIREKGRVIGFETRLNRKDGTILWASLSARTISDTYGKLMYYEGSILDITDRKKREAAENERAAAQAASKAKSEFLANMSHEIRTPLNSILGFSEILSLEIKDTAHKDYLSSIISSGKSLLTLINDILDLSKVEAGKMTLEYSEFSVHTIFKEMEQIFSEEMHKKGLEFKAEVDPHLPPSIILDETRLRQILLNLIGNAVKFTQSGYIRLTVSKVFTAEDNSKIDLFFMVEDTGCGISKDQLETVFKAFAQQKGQSHAAYGGTGLGLTITQKLVEMMGGRIKLVSHSGGGSTFHVTFKDVEVASKMPSGKVINSDIDNSEQVKSNESDLIDVNQNNDSRDKMSELHKILGDRFLVRWNELFKTQNIDEIKAFAIDALTVGDKYSFSPLINWGRNLRHQTEIMDIEGLTATLKRFPDIVKSLQNIEYPKSF